MNGHKKRPGEVFELTRRKFSGMVGGAGLLTLAGCGGGGSDAVSEAAPLAPSPVPQPPPAVPAPPPVSQAAISLLAGGLGGGGWLEGRGTLAHLSRPEPFARTPDGTLYFIAREIVLASVSAQGDVRFLGRLPDGFVSGIATDSQGVVYVAGLTSSTIYKRTGSEPLEFTAIAGPAAGLKQPLSPVFDKTDNLYFIDFGNRQIRRISRDGTLTTLAGQPAQTTLADGQGNAVGFADPRQLLLMPDGSFLVVDGNRLRRMSPDGTVTTLPRALPEPPPYAFVVNDANSLYGVQGHSIVRLTLDSGVVVTVAGDAGTPGYSEGTGTAARFNMPRLNIEASGQLTVGDLGNDVIRRLDPTSGQTSLLIGSVPQPGHVDGTGAQARFADIGPMATDTAGNVYVLETAAKTLRMVTPAGVASTLFQDFPSAGGLAVDAGGNFYGVRDRTIFKVTRAGVQSVLAGQAGPPGFADGTGTAAQFASPGALAIDLQGNLLVGDNPVFQTPSFSFTSTLTYGNTIRRITPAGVVSTIAGVPGRVFQFGSGAPPLAHPVTEFHAPSVIALDAAGQIYVLDALLRNIRRLGPAGADPVVMAVFDNPRTTESEMAVAPDGTVFFAQHASLLDSGGGLKNYDTIRKVVSATSSVAVVGQEITYGEGVALGPHPGALNFVTGLVAAGNSKLYCISENSVLEIQLA
jgi:sugar lactone lactonase YvrE